MSNANNNLTVALRYDGEGAPRVTASGQGQSGERILELAQQHNIPIHQDAALAEALSSVPLDDEIPLALYTAVAEVLAFVYMLNDDQSVADYPN